MVCCFDHQKEDHRSRRVSTLLSVLVHPGCLSPSHVRPVVVDDGCADDVTAVPEHAGAHLADGDERVADVLELESERHRQVRHVHQQLAPRARKETISARRAGTGFNQGG